MASLPPALQQLLAVLDGTLQADNAIRRAAEKELLVMGRNEGFLSTLLQLVASPEFAEGGA